MSENEFYKIDKLMPYKTKVREGPLPKDGDLQVHLSNTQEASHLENANAFNKLLSYYHEVGRTQNAMGGSSIGEREAVRLAMEDAESMFNSMMEISKQLRQACQELMQMQT